MKGRALTLKLNEVNLLRVRWRKNYATVEVNLKRQQKQPPLILIYNLLGTKIFVFLDVVPITFLAPHS